MQPPMRPEAKARRYHDVLHKRSLPQNAQNIRSLSRSRPLPLFPFLSLSLPLSLPLSLSLRKQQYCGLKWNLKKTTEPICGNSRLTEICLQNHHLLGLSHPFTYIITCHHLPSGQWKGNLQPCRSCLGLAAMASCPGLKSRKKRGGIEMKPHRTKSNDN